MEIHKDFRELLALLNENNVEYLIIGGYALAFHGAPRYTGDLDIYIKPDAENAKKIIFVLNEFGFGSLGLEEKDFCQPDMVVQLGNPPLRIDIITSISGVQWHQAYSNKVASSIDSITVNFISREDLIKNKKAIGRKKDEADIEALDDV